MTTSLGPTTSLPELLVFQELLRRRLQPGLDFYFQVPMFGSGYERGSYRLDFIFSNPPGLAINVQGEYFHYDVGSERQALDRLLRIHMAGQLITLIWIDESAAIERTRWIVGEALQFRDHSRFA